jgi:multimeric flavodoxin WrbA
MAIPTWLGQPSSVSKVALERMDAFLSETSEDDKTPIAYNRVAGVVVVGNEDGAHHVIEEWLTTEERDWSITTAKACASNLLAMARALESSPIPPPPEG